MPAAKTKTVHPPRPETGAVYFTNVAVDLAALVDFTAGEAWMKSILYNDPEIDVDVDWEEWGKMYFNHLEPRKGILGFLRDHKALQGTSITYFSNVQDPDLATAAEQWLRVWTNNAFLVLHRMENLMGEPQIWLLAEGHEYNTTSTHSALAIVPSGPFDPSEVWERMKLS